MIDLHCHYLPGIDDGAQTLQESLDLAQAAVAAGITAAVMTPHVHPGRYENTASSVRKLCAAFQQVLTHKQIPLQIYVGGEVRVSSEIIDMVERDEIPFLGTLDGYRVLLLEFPHSHIVFGSDRLVSWLLSRNIRPLIAHPERNREVMRNVDKLQPFVAMGALLQLTGASIIGQFGKPALQCAREIIEKEWVTVVATDAHNLRHRPPNLDLAHQALVEIGGDAYARELTEGTPSRIVAGNHAIPHAPVAQSAPAATQ